MSSRWPSSTFLDYHPVSHSGHRRPFYPGRRLEPVWRFSSPYPFVLLGVNRPTEHPNLLSVRIYMGLEISAILFWHDWSTDGQTDRQTWILYVCRLLIGFSWWTTAVAMCLVCVLSYKCCGIVEQVRIRLWTMVSYRSGWVKIGKLPGNGLMRHVWVYCVYSMLCICKHVTCHLGDWFWVNQPRADSRVER